MTIYPNEQKRKIMKLNYCILTLVCLLSFFGIPLVTQAYTPGCDGLSDSDAKLCEEIIYQKYGVKYLGAPAPANQTCAIGGGGEQSTGSTFVNWNSGIKEPYIMEQYVIEVLKYIADFKEVSRDSVVTQEHTLALLAWAWGEGGDINNSSRFNLFNTSALRNDPQAMPYAAGGTDGRLAYANFDVGIKATAGTMLLPRYSRVIDALTKKDTSASDVLYAYTHYSQYPGNNWWALQNELDGEDVYFTKIKRILDNILKDYGRAATVIGTTDREQITGLRDTSKLTYSGSGAKPSSGGGVGTSTSGGICGNGSATNGGGIVDIAQQELAGGANESDGSYLKYTNDRKEAWCAWFVSWVYRKAGAPFTGGVGEGGYAYPAVSGMHAMARNNGWFHTKEAVIDNKFTPQPGDVAIYDEGVGDYPSHVNIVISYDSASKTYIAIGGNQGDAVQKRSHSVVNSSLSGFMRKGL